VLLKISSVKEQKNNNVAVLIWWLFGVLTTKLSSGALRHNPDMLVFWK
jgi:hypothetical protein